MNSNPRRSYRSSPIRLPERLAPPASFVAAAGDIPLDLEIGCGAGLHPIQYALQNPARNLIALEHTREKFESFERRYRGNGSPKNLWPVHANAITFVDQFIAPGSLSRIFLLYPNPNPKRASQRWFRMPFFEKLIDSLEEGGRLQLVTNIEAYAREAREYGCKHWGLSLQSERVLKGTGAEARTHFEIKYLDRGETCYDLVFAKNSR